MASSVRFRRAGLATAALASVFLLAACAPPTTPAEEYSGAPVSDHAGDAEGEHGGEEHAEGEPQAVWLGQGGQLAVTVSGSSTCPEVGTNIRVIDAAGEGNRVAIDLIEHPEDQVCTMDLVPHTTVFWTPMTVTTTEPLIVEVAGAEVEVPIK
ncbi:hypothetical protein [Agromyces subbeticus]|uniref:hypothetical protein n=1 Tax=Agromyces subbeticus TaxID=293890 RepID=UPI0012EB804D|nr:hypothetical protein [Agromyces subbeticus]